MDRFRAITAERVFSTPDGQQITFVGINSEAVMWFWLKSMLLLFGFISFVFFQIVILFWLDVLVDSVIKEMWDNGDPILPVKDRVSLFSHHIK